MEVEKVRLKPTGPNGKLPGKTEISAWFNELNTATDPRTKRYYRNLLGRKLSTLAQMQARRFSWASNQDDILSAGYEGLAMAIHTFDVSKCNNFYFWAKYYIPVKIGREKYAEQKWLECFGEGSGEEYDETGEVIVAEDSTEDEALNPEEHMIEKEFWELALNGLDQTSKCIFENMFGLGSSKESTLREMCERLNISRNKLARRQREIRRYVKSLYLSYA